MENKINDDHIENKCILVEIDNEYEENKLKSIKKKNF